MYYNRIRIPFNNLLLSLSEALELCSPALVHHQMRTAFIAWRIAEQAGLDPDETENIFLAALFHDVGALTPEEKVKLHQFEETNSYHHCRKGAILLEEVSWLAPAAPLVHYHHHPWHERSALPSKEVLRGSQILMLADHLERRINRPQYILHQSDEILAYLAGLADSQIDPELVVCLQQASESEEFWLDLTSPRLYSLLLNFGPIRPRELTTEDLHAVADLFSYIIDFRSRFTATHSAGVTASACRLAQLFGLTRAEVNAMGIAGQLHDLGKLSVPNTILEKPSGLTRQEFAIIRRHTYHTYNVLNMIGGLGPIPEWAAFHHENLHGTGYPFHLDEQNLSSGARIMQVADIFTAMAESRPYRKHGMSKDQICRIFKEKSEVGSLDKHIVRLLLDHYDGVRDEVLLRQEKAREFFENHFAPESDSNKRLCA